MQFPRAIAILLFASGIAPSQSVTFAARPAVVGSGARISMTSRLTMQGQDGGTVTTNHDKEVTVMAVQSGQTTQVKVHYIADHKASSIPRVEGERSPTEGRTYLAFANGDVTTTSGDAVSRTERSAVARDMLVGQPDPLARALDGKTSSVGALIPPEVLHAMLETKGLGSVKQATGRLTEIRQQGAVQLAVFALTVDTEMSKGLRAETAIRLTGHMVVAAPMGSLVSLELRGPVEVTTQKGLRPLRRARTREEMLGDFTISMNVSPVGPQSQPEAATPMLPPIRSSPPVPEPAPGPAPAVENLTGKWRTEQPGAVVEVYRHDDKLHGKLVLSPSPKVPVGTLLLRDLSETATGWAGKIYSPEHDRLLDAVLTTTGDQLTIRVSTGLGAKTITWTRDR